MTYRARVRVELPDQPGALGRLGGLLGDLGANVVSVDVHEAVDGTVLDDIVLDLPDELDPGTLRASMEEASVGHLVSYRPPRPWADPVVRALQWAESMADADGHARNEELARAISDVCATTGTWVASSEEAMAWPCGRQAMERGEPVVCRSDEVPPRLDAALDGTAWLLAVPDDGPASERVAFLARPIGQRFTATEMARVRGLLRVSRHLEHDPSLVASLLG